MVVAWNPNEIVLIERPIPECVLIDHGLRQSRRVYSVSCHGSRPRYGNIGSGVFVPSRKVSLWWEGGAGFWAWCHIEEVQIRIWAIRYTR